MTINTLLQALGDGEFHSGETLGERMGVSRAAVWKHLQKLEHYGLQLESVKGRGYRLLQPLELLNPQRIAGALSEPARAVLSELHILDECGSTNALAMQRTEVGPAHGYVCLAEYQTAGRGRRGRTWVSPYGSNIYLSCVAEFEGGVAALEGLSLAVGVALVEALTDLGVREVQLKWPNDLLWQGRKLAGILLEMSGDVSGRCQVVVGVGLNVRMAPASATGIDQPWVDVASICPDVSRNQLVAAVLNRLLPLLNSYARCGFAAYRETWEALHAYQNCAVDIHAGRTVVSGIVRGVSPVGALYLEVNGELQEFSGGEISLRVAT